PKDNSKAAVFQVEVIHVQVEGNDSRVKPHGKGNQHTDDPAAFQPLAGQGVGAHGHNHQAGQHAESRVEQGVPVGGPKIVDGGNHLVGIQGKALWQENYVALDNLGTIAKGGNQC